jgi:hypothetical protein
MSPSLSFVTVFGLESLVLWYYSDYSPLQFFIFLFIFSGVLEIKLGLAKHTFHQWPTSSTPALVLLLYSFLGRSYTFISNYPTSLCLWAQGFTLAKQTLYCLSHTSSAFCSGYFGDEVLWTICSNWLRVMILLISASKVARITGVSHWHPALHFFLITVIILL